MEDERRREIGLFRYALIRPCVEPGLSRAERGRLVRALAEAEHLGPDGRLVRVGARTNKERLYLRNVVEKIREPRQGRRGYATKEPFAVSRMFAVMQ